MSTPRIHGINSLDSTPIINGSLRVPIARYKCVDANVTNLVAWDYGATLVRQAVGVQPTYNNGAPAGAYSWDSNTDSCLFNESDYYQCADGTTGNVTDEDYFWELIGYFENSSVERFIDKRVPSNNGYSILNSTDCIRILIEDTPKNVTSIYSPNIATGWHHFCGYGNRDENSTMGAVTYADGVGGTGIDISDIGSLTNTRKLTMGATMGGAGNFGKGIIYFALWTASDMIAAGGVGKAEIDALALTRSNAFWGVETSTKTCVVIPLLRAEIAERIEDLTPNGYKSRKFKERTKAAQRLKTIQEEQGKPRLFQLGDATLNNYNYVGSSTVDPIYMIPLEIVYPNRSDGWDDAIHDDIDCISKALRTNNPCIDGVQHRWIDLEIAPIREPYSDDTWQIVTLQIRCILGVS